jgi:predicted DNA-binding WGR domain protein
MVDDDINGEVLPTYLHFRRIEPEHNMRRFYRLTVQHDLFGNVSLIRVWGRIGTRGRQIMETHADEGSAINALVELAQQKLRRGYGVVSSQFH